MIIRGAKALSIDDPIGFELAEGDQVQTGRGTLLEVRLLASGAIVKLAENTTFVLRRVSSSETSLALVYGRLRAKVEKLSGNQVFKLAGESAIAGVRGTDFGMDVLAPRTRDATAPRTDVYCFEGSVMVTALVDALAGSQEGLESIPKQFIVSAGEMVSVQKTKTASEAIKATIETSIEAFWKANDFTSSATNPVAAPESSTIVKPQDQGDVKAAALPANPPAAFAEGYDAGFMAANAALDASTLWAQDEMRILRKAASRQKGGFVAGGFIALTGVGLSVAGAILSESGDTASGSTLTTSGMVVSGLALPFFILAIAIGP
ncbi:MAG: hypothetical protein E4H20_03825 [Spirochaetales bacterium]|nr:MAG: hypothetical protein E4H20_03825 [Spirochaetales bacterium]